MDMTPVREISVAINTAHRFVYFVPEAAEAYGRLGITERAPAYFAARSAPLGPVPWQITLATFYNFSPRAVQAMAGVWDAATPEAWQAARFAVVARAMDRVGVDLSAEEVAEARALIDPVVAAADLAGKPLAAANAALALPADALTALWQQVTVLREWRGDAHIAVLTANGLGPCACNVMQTATGRFPVSLARATRMWNDAEWADASARLAGRGWLAPDGTVTDAGTAAREQIELETDDLCAPLWAAVGADGAQRLAALLGRINDAFAAAGTFSQL
ncbi:MAG: hypothetical protein OEY41_03270 [Acidimicrobiia bacterium]|nr:hypothetical protein [Acidimicrobiia bacterium]MDH5289001.1 hypothetical protein [Acidimicrobiia bacterium]